jgi:glycosyltransferase involved in cell wall biosynthesis
LIVVGDGPVLKELQTLAKSLAVEDKVQFLGEIPRTKLLTSDILYSALTFVTASTSETQGISILEAMAAGLPIIGVDAKAVPDLIEKNGILCQPNSAESLTKAMYILATDPEKVAKYKKASLEVAKKHSIKSTIEKLEKIYERVQKD